MIRLFYYCVSINGFTFKLCYEGMRQYTYRGLQLHLFSIFDIIIILWHILCAYIYTNTDISSLNILKVKP